MVMRPASRIPSPLRGGVGVGVVQKAPLRSILNHPHLRLLPARGRRGAAAFAVLLMATPALADDKAACADGIADIRAKVAGLSPDAVPQKLRKALRVAEREQGEGEFDECLEALEDAKRALPR